MKKTTLARLLMSLAMISVLMYLSNPASALALMLSANIHYLAFAVLIYPAMIFIYAMRWKFILSRMGDHLPMLMAYQAVSGSAMISDFTPARLGDLLRPLMIKDRVKVNQGLASIVVDHYADMLASILLGLAGLLILPHKWNWYVIAVVSGLLFGLSLIALLWLERDLVLRILVMTGSMPTIRAVQSLYRAVEAIEGASRVLAAAVVISLTIWAPYALRIFLIARALGYDAPLHMVFFLMPLVSMLTALPITISGLGLAEGGMTAMMATMGVPATAGLSVALIDRVLSMATNALFGMRYASRLLRSGT
ncbi:MAG TPA: lysylphosphatidylglycerol synthase transmembrane domain-containing protein [Methanotrichaceae archaeon]|nr:lysylphosphatidylglycerol synthase transmembrane domain-containing protein [Methanotrichaceae archaeon]